MGWASQERDFSKPVFPNLLKIGMCVPKVFFFCEYDTKVFYFSVEIVGVGKLCYRHFVTNKQTFFSCHISTLNPLLCFTGTRHMDREKCDSLDFVIFGTMNPKAWRRT